MGLSEQRESKAKKIVPQSIELHVRFVESWQVVGMVQCGYDLRVLRSGRSSIHGLRLQDGMRVRHGCKKR